MVYILLLLLTFGFSLGVKQDSMFLNRDNNGKLKTIFESKCLVPKLVHYVNNCFHFRGDILYINVGDL